MDFVSRYTAYQPDEQGFVTYSQAEHHVWHQLFSRQKKLLPGRACDEYLDGLATLKLTADCIPQLPDVSRVLSKLTNWQVTPVAALISARSFFELLATRRFPAATFIRTEAELDYVKEPDIFHELFGHCPMLTNPIYADFLQQYAQLVLTFPEADWPLLQRLFWFTVEFGLIFTDQGLRIYGGGILSSVTESVYCVDSDKPIRALLNPLVAFRTPYRIDELQSVYFIIHDFQELYHLVALNLKDYIQQARALNEFPPCFPIDEQNPNIHIHAC